MVLRMEKLDEANCPCMLSKYGSVSETTRHAVAVLRACRPTLPKGEYGSVWITNKPMLGFEMRSND
jgi:hypothetical protein